jgi:hypothetical protein
MAAGISHAGFTILGKLLSGRRISAVSRASSNWAAALPDFERRAEVISTQPLDAGQVA